MTAFKIDRRAPDNVSIASNTTVISPILYPAPAGSKDGSGKIFHMQATYCPRYSIINPAPSACLYAYTKSVNSDMSPPRTSAIECEAHKPSTAVTDTPKAECSKE